MALTKIRNDQIKDLSITNQQIATNAAIAYSKLDLAGSLVGTDLAAANGSSVHTAVLDSHLLSLWNIVNNTTVSGTTEVVTTQVTGAAVTDAPTTSHGTKGILTTDSSGGAGTSNYRVQIRNSTTKDPVEDGLSGTVYGELSHDGSDFTLTFKDSEGNDFTMGAAEVQSVDAVADVSGSLNNKYWYFDTPDNEYYVWYNVGSGGTDPSVSGRTGVEIAIAQDATADAVASATASALDLLTDVSSSATTNSVTVTNSSAGDVAAAGDGQGTSETGFSFAVTSQGSPGTIDFMFAEVYSYYNAPTDAFMRGVGFVDVVGVAGTHNHNDLYYTKLELESGQLDDRYYTETELTNGQLDSRYFTEVELDPSATLGANVLDARYYTESELGSVTGGASGADLIGFTSTGNLASDNVQDALVELQGDIDDIVSGGLDITHSMDDAYDDGSIVEVDDSTVDFRLADTKQFVVSDGTSPFFSITRNDSTGDTISVDSDVFDVNSASGASISTTDSNLALETLTSGDASITSAGEINLTSTGNQSLESAAELTFKDQHLTAGIPISETGEVELVGYTATSIVGALNEALSTASSSATIGDAEDGTYTDGLFVDFVDTTPTGTAVDRFNEVLKSLAPKPAPTLSDIGTDNGGVTGKLSFGTSNTISGYTNHPSLDVGGTYTKSGDTMGIFDNSGTLSGYLADNVPAGGASDRPYPARAFGDADSGNLVLRINGVDEHTVDLSSFGSGNSFNVNGSGFTLSAATSVKFDNGDSFEVFKYRTGSWTVNVADCDLGYNTVQVVHDGDVTNILNFVIDDDTTATAYSAESISGLTMTESNHISGVEYHMAGSATYNATVSNAYRNTYSHSSSALDFTATNATATDEALSAPATESDAVNIAKSITVNSSSRLLDGTVTANVKALRTLQTTSTSSGASVSGILLDATSANSSATSEQFNDEDFRVAASLDETTTSGYTSGGISPSDWDSTQSLVGVDAGHNTGLLVYNGSLMYPTQGLNGGDFSSVTNGPAGNVDYSGATGDRTFYRFFYTSALMSMSNFNVAITSSNTSFVNVATGPSGNDLTMEVLAPNTTQDGSGTVEWKDAVVPYVDNDSIGCYAATYGSTIPTNWGLTLGTRNTSTSGDVIVIRITASAAWTGNIDSITLT